MKTSKKDIVNNIARVCMVGIGAYIGLKMGLNYVDQTIAGMEAISAADEIAGKILVGGIGLGVGTFTGLVAAALTPSTEADRVQYRKANRAHSAWVNNGGLNG